jgi:hypothetical protein
MIDSMNVWVFQWMIDYILENEWKSAKLFLIEILKCLAECNFHLILVFEVVNNNVFN